MSNNDQSNYDNQIFSSGGRQGDDFTPGDTYDQLKNSQSGPYKNQDQDQFSGQGGDANQQFGRNQSQYGQGQSTVQGGDPLATSTHPGADPRQYDSDPRQYNSDGTTGEWGGMPGRRGASGKSGVEASSQNYDQSGAGANSMPSQFDDSSKRSQGNQGDVSTGQNYNDQDDSSGTGTGTGVGAGGRKPGMGDKIRGNLESMAGKVTKDQGLVEKGQDRKTGNW